MDDASEVIDACWEQTDENRPLLDLLPALPDDERFTLISDGEGVVAWGVAARIPIAPGRDRFERARESLTAIAGGNQVLAFLSFTFDEEHEGSVMIVPKVAIRRHGGNTQRMTIQNVSPVKALAIASTPDTDRPRYAGSTVRDEAWLEAVATVIRQIDGGAYEKVVLARDLRLWSKQPFDTTLLLKDLAVRFPSCWLFLVDHLLGASPELLLLRSGLSIRSRVLAGTAPRGDDTEADEALAAELLASPKDRHEHDLALASAVNALAPHCVRIDVPDEPILTRLENVQHLRSDIDAELRQLKDRSLPHILSLLGDLHPTAAVGGAPRQAALDAIRTLEGMERGRYSGPVGWCTSDGDGEFAIALRCAEIRDNQARLFAGAGIVAGSLPESELKETWQKLRGLTRAFEQIHTNNDSGSRRPMDSPPKIARQSRDALRH